MYEQISRLDAQVALKILSCLCLVLVYLAWYIALIRMHELASLNAVLIFPRSNDTTLGGWMVMAWYHASDKQWSPCSLTCICIARSAWVKDKVCSCSLYREKVNAIIDHRNIISYPLQVPHILFLPIYTVLISYCCSTCGLYLLFLFLAN